MTLKLRFLYDMASCGTLKLRNCAVAADDFSPFASWETFYEKRAYRRLCLYSSVFASPAFKGLRFTAYKNLPSQHTSSLGASFFDALENAHALPERLSQPSFRRPRNSY